jgi:nitroimidazol reductase NimA-like FMN-containing flavoprotein (pyridoxamine 5'-phosphate oxidase superfamily)
VSLTAMTRAEREAFLAGVHVGVLGLADGARGPLTVPIWYDYVPGGELRFVTGRSSRKGTLLAIGGRVSLCAQTEAPPYKYVSVEGAIVAVDPADVDSDVRPIARRYLGREGGDRYVESTRDMYAAEENVLVRVRVEHWLSVDYAKQYAPGG